MTAQHHRIQSLLYVLIVLFAFVWVFLPTSIQAQSQNRLKEIEERINELKRQRDEINAQIQAAQNAQESLAQQAQLLDAEIARSEIAIQSFQLELDKLNVELEVLRDEQRKLQERLDQVKEELKTAETELKISVNLLYKLSKNSLSILDKDMNFREVVIGEEKERTTLRLIKAKIKEIENLKSQIEQKKSEIDAKEKQASELKDQLEGQKNLLDLQKQALAIQKEYKQNLIIRYKRSQEDLSNKKNAYERRIRQSEEEKAMIEAALRNSIVSGTRVNAGDVIGFQGRTGLSCSSPIPGATPYPDPESDPCRKVPYTDGFYYYDPNTYPAAGSHLHFVYNDTNGYRVNLNQYFPYGGPIIKPPFFDVLPISRFVVTQQFYSGHQAIDMDGGHGAPVYAIKSGVISYFCSAYNRSDPVLSKDPGFGAIIIHDDGSKSVYYHIQRNQPCPQWL
ncbi:MAG: hypothetical protein KatS3mg084_0594 [Candidatus Dojkabacteria bacterium]|nr:MAG: hypothetical protein KatS3mg084_0594 [Candidatus Dojkabacteria bacterium]